MSGGRLLSTALLVRAHKAASLAHRPLSSTAVRAMAAAADSNKGAIHPVYFKIKERQKQYQVDNGLRINQRHGFSGTVLWYITVALMVGAAIDGGMFMVSAMFPPKA